MNGMIDIKVSVVDGKYDGGIYSLSSAVPLVTVIIEIYDSDYCCWEASCLVFTDEAVEFEPLSPAAQEANFLKEIARKQIEKRYGIKIGYPIIDGIYSLEELEIITRRQRASAPAGH